MTTLLTIALIASVAGLIISGIVFYQFTKQDSFLRFK
jgi:hypothetical protein